MGIILVKGDNVFKIDNELKSANIPRTVRFTEPLFEKLNKTAAERPPAGKTVKSNFLEQA